MTKYRKKPVVIEATQWFKNGDHPLDHDPIGIKNPHVNGQSVCNKCKRTMSDHGWIDTLEGGHIVCPGDWIITGVQGEYYPCKPDIFDQTYELVDESL